MNSKELPRNIKAPLEMTAADHEAIGSTPSKELLTNSGKTLAETMNDESLEAFIQEQVDAVAVSYKGMMTGNPTEKMIFDLQLRNFLAPNIRYLRTIGRLPTKFKDFDPEKEFVLPKS